MQFTTLLVAFTAFSASLIPSVTNALALPPAVVARDVFVPKINSPNNGTVWVIGAQAVVTWQNANAPDNISNGASVLLRKAGTVLKNSTGQMYYLTQGFDLRAGFVEFIVPTDLVPGDDYAITLFGDSGNISQNFTISTQEP
ncbi:hypothetical protein D9758_000967 [Tetrapyrgos nigripes]|uniref:Yeast cell wall synthesis Kre9/Knh1-like N-terminal domain-containing protein n=1 Tax=Tetrapyrgos nigripes TaxID=182062 RepID=A0A8H5GZ31_9AGAR|nr:hypothetical protein D9758_000967 [Tetrapyrgos nigripes]